jgi:hypothetical protein
MDASSASRRRFEPWPWILAGMLGAMIATSLGFLAIASTHPDPEVERVELRSTSAVPPEPTLGAVAP